MDPLPNPYVPVLVLLEDNSWHIEWVDVEPAFGTQADLDERAVAIFKRQHPLMAYAAVIVAPAELA